MILDRAAGMRNVFIAAVFSLAACTPTVWDKPGATQADYNTDHYNCEKDARQSGYFGGGIAGAINIRNFFRECMIPHGWSARGDTSA